MIELKQGARHFRNQIKAWRKAPDRWESLAGRLVSARLIARLDGILEVLSTAPLDPRTVARLERVMQFDGGESREGVSDAPAPAHGKLVQQRWQQDELPGLWADHESSTRHGRGPA